MDRQPSAPGGGRKRNRWLTAAALLGILGIAATLLTVRRGQDLAPTAAAAPPKAVKAISCAGRIEPAEGITKVGAANANGRPPLVAELRVKEGDQVRAGQLLAVLDTRPQLEAVLRQSEARVTLAQRRLEQVQAGPRPGDLAAQRAAIAGRQAAYDNARAEYGRYEELHRKRDVSTSELEAKKTDVETSGRLLEEAVARLQGIQEIRPEDVRLAESEVAVARAEADRVRIDVDTSVVRSPRSGRVLHIRARAGEEVREEGLLELAGTDAMYALAEVYETDIGRVRAGQRAMITGGSLAEPLWGTVELIGSEIGRAQVSPADAAAFADSRVVTVRIRLENGAPAGGLIHAKVAVVIGP